jgi:putative Holliday junction resolvase
MPEARPASAQTLLGLDFGLRRIGVAVGQTATGSASPLCTLAAREGEPQWAELDRLVAQWAPGALVVGMPLTADGGAHPLRRAVRRFCHGLDARYGLPVYRVDERYSSAEAAGQIREARREGRRGRTAKGALDMLSAALLLEQWMTSGPES